MPLIIEGDTAKKTFPKLCSQDSERDADLPTGVLSNWTAALVRYFNNAKVVSVEARRGFINKSEAGPNVSEGKRNISSLERAIKKTNSYKVKNNLYYLYYVNVCITLTLQ